MVDWRRHVNKESQFYANNWCYEIIDEVVLWTQRRDTSTLLKTLCFSEEVLPKVNPAQKSGVSKIKRVEKDMAKRENKYKDRDEREHGSAWEIKIVFCDQSI